MKSLLGEHSQSHLRCAKVGFRGLELDLQRLQSKIEMCHSEVAAPARRGEATEESRG